MTVSIITDGLISFGTGQIIYRYLMGDFKVDSKILDVNINVDVLSINVDLSAENISVEVEPDIDVAISMFEDNIFVED